MDPMDLPEYQEGVTWARANKSSLVERYTGKELNTPELRTHLFEEAVRLYPDERESMDNRLRQTAWVAGAFKAIIQDLNFTREALLTVMETAQEMGMVFSVEWATKELIEEILGKGPVWWASKHGDVTLKDLFRALSIQWNRQHRKEKGRLKSIVELMIDQLGSRELNVLANLENIEYLDEGLYKRYVVTSPGNSFEVMAHDAVEKGRILQGAGEIVG